jgi:diketogulonate reductase-like aldo/keto reductase
MVDYFNFLGTINIDIYMENQLIKLKLKQIMLEMTNLCRSLQLEHIDLYLIHWPISARPGRLSCDEEDLMPMDFKSVWAAMEECQRLGLAKSIGVSNFSCKKLQNLLSSATIPPSVNQVSPLHQLQLLFTNNIY